MRFNKPALSISDQIAKLQSRGLVIPDAAAAAQSLHLLAPDTSWHLHLRDLIARYPVVPIKAMGFPSAWQMAPFWNFPPNS